MGWFYGYASIGNYAALKTGILSYRESYKDGLNLYRLSLAAIQQSFY